MADLTRKYPNVYTDLAGRLESLGASGGWTAEALVAVIRRDRVFYATNFPLPDTRKFLAAFRGLPLDDTEYELIAWRNATRFLEAAAPGRPPGPA